MVVALCGYGPPPPVPIQLQLLVTANLDSNSLDKPSPLLSLLGAPL